MTEEEIHNICEKYHITNYTINSDMSIDVNGNVYLDNKTFEKLPLKFNEVTGNFYCSYNKLTTLEGCPDYVGANFYCSYNKLTTLEGCPKYVGGGINCVYNRLTTLQHLPVNFHIGEYFLCDGNRIDNPGEFGKLFFGYIGGTIMSEIATSNNDLNEFLNKHKNPPKKDLPRLLSELRKMKI